MDYESVWRALCRNTKDLCQGKKTEAEHAEYKRGVFDCLFHLDLTEEYYAWCEDNNIPGPDYVPEDESYLGYT